MNKWLIGTSAFAVIGALAVGCTVEDDEPGTNLGGSTPTGGARTGGAATGGAGGEVSETGGAEAGGVEAGGAGGEVAETGGAEAGGVGGEATGGAETGGAEVGGAGGEVPETGGATAGGATAGGAGGAGGAVIGCLGGDDLGALDSSYDDCSEWSYATFATQQCGTGDPDVNGPLADDLCWYYLPTARSEVFDALLYCFSEYSGGTDCGKEHDDFMWACVSAVGARACATTDGTAFCESVTSDCGDVTQEFCEGEVNLLVETERSAVSDCWDSLTNRERTGGSCADNFDSCI